MKIQAFCDQFQVDTYIVIHVIIVQIYDCGF